MTIKWKYLVCPECGSISVVRGISNKYELKCDYCKAECKVFKTEAEASMFWDSVKSNFKSDKKC